MPQALPLWEGTPPFGVDNASETPLLTPYLAGEGTRGAVIICPGGGYAMRAEHEGAPIAASINRCGCHAFVLDYRVQPHRHPAPLADAQRAIRMVRHNAAAWGVDPTHIAILGFSAGGHLCTMAATHYDEGNPQAEDPVERVSCRPDAFIPCYPVVSFARFTHSGSRKNLTGKDALTREEAQFFSGEYNVTGDTPPAFLWHTAEDETVPVENSLLLAQALVNHRVPVELHIFPYGPHGIGLAADNPLAKAWPDLLNAWLLQQGFGRVK